MSVHCYNMSRSYLIGGSISFLVVGSLIVFAKIPAQRTPVISSAPTPTLGIVAMPGSENSGHPTPPSTSRIDCARDTAAQLAYLAAERYSSTFTFSQYQVQEYSGPLHGSDISSNPYARLFRTSISGALVSTGINFAGRYSIVSVGMTGWGDNYFIVDRTNGATLIFPYSATILSYRPDSALLIVNSKEELLKIVSSDRDELGPLCYRYSLQSRPVDDRPFYLRWTGTGFEQLAPSGETLKPNPFWASW